MLYFQSSHFQGCNRSVGSVSQMVRYVQYRSWVRYLRGSLRGRSPLMSFRGSGGRSPPGFRVVWGGEASPTGPWVHGSHGPYGPHGPLGLMGPIFDILNFWKIVVTSRFWENADSGQNGSVCSDIQQKWSKMVRQTFSYASRDCFTAYLIKKLPENRNIDIFDRILI